MRARLTLLVAATAGALLTGPLAAGTSVAAPAPGGRILATDGNTGQVVTMQPDGSDITAITPSGGFAIHAKWSHDGSRAVFAANYSHAGFRIYTVAADGTDLRQVTTATRGVNDFTPTFDRDGSHVLFSRCRSKQPDGCAMFSIRADGTDRRQLTVYGLWQDFWPDVSPDGTRIAFNRAEYNGVEHQIWVMDIDGSDAHAITDPALEASTPRWTPDGAHLLVSTNWSHLGDNVYRIDDDGSHATALTDKAYPHNAAFGSYSPSGTKIAYSDDQASKNLQAADIKVMNADGSGKHTITTGTHYFGPDWGATAPSSSTAAVRSVYRLGGHASLPRLPAGVRLSR